MRVTENTNYDAIRNSIQRSKGRMEQYQLQSATMKKINTPSDNPIAAGKVLEMRTEKVNIDQFQDNSRIATMFLENTDHALDEISNIIMRARELAMAQASGPSSSEATRLGVAEEVEQLYQQAISAANRRVGDRYLFGGFKTDRPPVDNEGKYLGDDGQPMVEISRDVYISTSMPGFEVFNTNPKFSADSTRLGYSSGRELAVSEIDPNVGTENVNLFNEIRGLRIALLTGDIESVRDSLETLDLLQQKVLSVRSKVGSRIQGIQSAQTSMEKTALSNANLSSQLEDADMAQVMSDLAREETVYRSALQSSKRLIQPTLLDFIK